MFWQEAPESVTHRCVLETHSSTSEWKGTARWVGSIYEQKCVCVCVCMCVFEGGTLALSDILEGVPSVARTLVGAGSVGTDLRTLVSTL